MRLNQPRFMLSIAIFASSAAAQTQDPIRRDFAGIVEHATFRIILDGEHQFETDIDDGGKYHVNRYGLSGAADFNLTDSLAMTLSLGYERSEYDFKDDSGLGMVDPWDNVDTLRFGWRTRLRIGERMRLFMGPVLSLSAESTASLGDGFIGGGVFGATWQLHEKAVIGGGVGILSDIEDDIQFYPIIILDWKFAPGFTLRTAGGGTDRAGGGVELEWTPIDQWAFTVGGAYRSRRFRLDDQGPAPDGVGEENILPLYGRIGYRPISNLEFNITAGYIIDGELILEDMNGDELADEDFDPTPFIGAGVSFRF